MKATDIIQSFPVARSIVHIGSAGSAALLQPPFVKAELAELDGRVLATFPISNAADAHSDVWEMHPDADEVLFMLTGELGLEYSDSDRTRSRMADLRAGEGVVVPKGVWHRLHFREPGLLLALTATRGTRSSARAGVES
jgi:mannose-6-phosphate isomerase-like protein (cupin superfamily)